MSRYQLTDEQLRKIEEEVEGKEQEATEKWSGLCIFTALATAANFLTDGRFGLTFFDYMSNYDVFGFIIIVKNYNIGEFLSTLSFLDYFKAFIVFWLSAVLMSIVCIYIPLMLLHIRVFLIKRGQRVLHSIIFLLSIIYGFIGVFVFPLAVIILLPFILLKYIWFFKVF